MTLENYAFLVYMYYMHPGYWTCIFGKNRAYYIGIFTVCVKSDSVTKNNIFGKYFHRTDNIHLKPLNIGNADQ